MYEDFKDRKNNSKIKKFINKKAHLGYIIGQALYSTICVTSILSMVEGVDKLENLELQELESSAENRTDNKYYDFESICNAIQLASTLNSEDKDLLYNEELFKALSNTQMTEDRIMSLEEKLTDIQILSFTEEDLQENQNRYIHILA